MNQEELKQKDRATERQKDHLNLTLMSSFFSLISDSLTNDGPRNAGWIYLVIVVDAKLPNVDHVYDDVDINFGVDFVDSIQ